MVITLIVYILLLIGLLLLALTTSKTMMVLPDYSEPVMISLYVATALLIIVVIILTIIFGKAHFILPLLSVARIYGVNESHPDQELGLLGEDLVMLDLNGIHKMVMLR